VHDALAQHPYALDAGACFVTTHGTISRSVEVATDALVQRVLATALRGRTVITIAHRLDTLANSDAIVDLGAARAGQR